MNQPVFSKLKPKVESPELPRLTVTFLIYTFLPVSLEPIPNNFLLDSGHKLSIRLVMDPQTGQPPEK